MLLNLNFNRQFRNPLMTSLVKVGIKKWFFIFLIPWYAYETRDMKYFHWSFSLNINIFEGLLFLTIWLLARGFLFLNYIIVDASGLPLLKIVPIPSWCRWAPNPTLRNANLGIPPAIPSSRTTEAWKASSAGEDLKWESGII